MLALDVVTTLSIGLLIGVEFAVSAFIKPVLSRLDERAQANAVGLFARRLGSAMPFWYVGSLEGLRGGEVAASACDGAHRVDRGSFAILEVGLTALLRGLRAKRPSPRGGAGGLNSFMKR